MVNYYISEFTHTNAQREESLCVFWSDGYYYCFSFACFVVYNQNQKKKMGNLSAWLNRKWKFQLLWWIHWFISVNGSLNVPIIYADSCCSAAGTCITENIHCDSFPI